MLTNEQFHEYLLKAYNSGWVYWYGTYGKLCTQSLYNSKKKQYPKHYTDDRTTKYMKHISEGRYCADCIGLGKAFVWSGGVFEGTPKYQANGMPDKSANGMFEYAKKQGLKNGTIDTIPEIPGIAVRYDGHVGYYIGNGEVIEERGFNYGCVKTKLKDRKWLNWYEVPGITYAEQPKPEPQPEPQPEPEPSTGKYILVCNGNYNVRTGPSTSNKKVGVAHKGDVLQYLGVTMNKWYNVVFNGQKVWISSKCGDIVGGPTVYFKVKSGSWNIRKGPSTLYSKIATAIGYDNLEYLGQIKNGWYYVKYGEYEGWISGKGIVKQ